MKNCQNRRYNIFHIYRVSPEFVSILVQNEVTRLSQELTWLIFQPWFQPRLEVVHTFYRKCLSLHI